MSTEIRSAREAMTIFKILGIKEITTERQRKNGTQVFELPIIHAWGPHKESQKPLRFATYSSGYVRNVTGNLASYYQINKKKGGNGYRFETTERILIPSWEERLIYLAKFIIKNYYKKPTYLISDWTMNNMKEQYKLANDLRNQTDKLPFGDECESEVFHEGDKFLCSTDVEEFVRQDVQVIINGHRYNLS